MQHLFEGKVWESVRSGLSEGLSGNQKKVFESVLEHTRNQMLQESASIGAVNSGNIATINKIILPVLRRVMPNVIANELIGVQPLSGPVAQINTMRLTYNNTFAGVNAGTEALSPYDIARAYSGNGNIDEPKAAPTAVLEGTPGKQIGMQVIKQTAEARTRRISARWTVEASQDADSQFGISLEDELLSGLASEITQEIDQEILYRLRKLARTGAVFDMGADSFTGSPTFVGDRHAVLITLINQEANKIAARTRRGRANWMVVDPMALTVLQSASTSGFARTFTGDPLDTPDNQKLVGTLNNSIRVYSDTYADEGTPVLLGYKGQSEADAGAFYCPYIPLMASDIVTDPNTFEKVVSFITRYAYVELNNSASSFGNAADYVSKIAIPAGSLKFM